MKFKKRYKLAIYMPLAITCWILSGHSYSMAQETQSGRNLFKQMSTWDEVLELAKKEGKYIFVECYATWCGPCKIMERDVFTQSEVIDFADSNLISVKLQMDETGKDSEVIKNWYSTADSIAKKHKVTSYPTYLFLSEDGSLVHKGIGLYSPPDFLSLMATAINDCSNFAGRTEAYMEGTLNIEEYGDFAISLKVANEFEIAESIATKYKNLYLEKMKTDTLLSPRNIKFIQLFPEQIRLDDSYFNLFLNSGELADSLTGFKGFSNQFINYIITKDVIRPFLHEDGRQMDDTDWKELCLLLESLYPDLTLDRIITASKAKWYKEKENWPLYVENSIRQIESDGPDTTGINKVILNNFVFEVIFKYGTSPDHLDKGIKWMEMLLNQQPEDYHYLDTYANLLYKNGNNSKAIKIQEQLLELIEDENSKIETGTITNRKKLVDASEFKETLNKMKAGKPTWL